MAKKKVTLKKKKSEDSLSITFSQPFAAVINQDPSTGKKVLEISSRDFYQHQLNKFKTGEKVTLELHTRKVKRSEAQNRYYWGVYLPLIANETGERNLDSLHQLFSGMFLTKSISMVLGKPVRIKKSTTELGVAEFIEYIMSIEAETGIAAPPTENYDLAPLVVQPMSDENLRRESTD